MSYINISAKFMKHKPIFTHVPDWLGIYHPGKITINNPQFHYYISRSEMDQPVTLYLQQEDRPESKEIKMYFTIEKQQKILQKEKDSSGLKDFAYLAQLQQQEAKRITVNKQSIYNQSSWIRKYQPKKFTELLTDELHNRNVLTWLKSWDSIVFKKTHKIDTVPSLFKKSAPATKFNGFYNQQFNYKKLILLAGPPGCGKTTLARVIAKHCGYHYEQINASDDRSGKALISKIDSLVSNQTIRVQKKPTCVIIDEVDGALDSDSNGIKEVLAYIQTGQSNETSSINSVSNTNKGIYGVNASNTNKDNSKKQKTQSKVTFGNLKGKKTQNHQKPQHQNQSQYKSFKSFSKKGEGQEQSIRRTKLDRPIIFICNDPFVKGLKDLRNKAIVVYFHTLQEQRVVKRLKEITQYQNCYIQTEILTRICQMCNNDVRSSVGILELLVQLKNQLNLSPKQIMNRMKFSYIKDVNTTTNQFLSKVMHPLTKLNNQKNIFKSYQYTISQHDNLSLLNETFFHNILNNHHIFFKTEALIGLYGQLSKYDVMLKQSFIHHVEPSQFAIFPYAYYRIHIKSEENKKIEFPGLFFEKLNKQKSNLGLIQKVQKGIPSSFIPFISRKNLVHQYLYVFWLTMQTSSTREEDVLKCVYKLLTYGIKLGVRNSPYLFNPEIDILLTFGAIKPEINFSNSSRSLMEENYQFLKLKSQLVDDVLFDNNKQNLQNVINQLKKNRRRKRDSHNGQVKYKYLQGTGTQVKYDLKIGYFFPKNGL